MILTLMILILLKDNSSNFQFWDGMEKSETNGITSSVGPLQMPGPNTCSHQSQLQSQIKSLEASSPSSLPTAFVMFSTLLSHRGQGSHGPAHPTESQSGWV